MPFLFVAAVLQNIYGAFTKVSRFDLVKAVAHGTAGRYGQKAPIPMVFKPSLILLESVQICKEKNKIKDLHIFAIIIH
jgi:hypothetical protein